jgi:hypothetical protein
MAFNVNEFRAQLVGDGARPNLFAVTLVFPPFVPLGSSAGQKITFMAKSAQLPGSTLGTVPMYYFGRELKFAGNRTFADWTLTIINDEDFIIRNALEQWSSSINSHVANLRNVVAENQTTYAVDAAVSQFGKDGRTLNAYNFVGMFPTDIAPIDLDWGSNDSIEEYSVTFSYQYWSNAASTDS